MKIILRDARFSIEGAYDTIQEALELALLLVDHIFYEKTLRKDLEIIIKIKEAQTFSELCESFVKMEKPRLLDVRKKQMRLMKFFRISVSMKEIRRTICLMI